MMLYSKNRKIYGTLDNLPKESNPEVIYRDSQGNKLTLINNDTYLDKGNHDVSRLSDQKDVNVFIGLKNVIPGNFMLPTTFTKPVKLEDYLYEMTYTSYDIQHAVNQTEDRFLSGGKCSSVHIGNWVARNLDWNYDENVTFVIHTPAIAGRHASVAIADCIPQLTKDIVEQSVATETYPEIYNALPCRIADGVNDAGVYINTNIVLLDYGAVMNTNDGKPLICSALIPRLVLDYADNAKDALKIFDEYSFYGISSLTGEEQHFMISDTTSTYVVEFINNNVHIMSDQEDGYDDIPNKNIPIMTNFNLANCTFTDTAPLVSTGSTEEVVKASGMSPHSMGVERYNTLYTNAVAPGFEANKNSITALIDKVKYSLCYAEGNTWRTEDVGTKNNFGKDYTIYSTSDYYSDVMAERATTRANWARNYTDTWQTVHCTVCDLQNKKLYLRVQLGDKDPFAEDVPATIVEREFSI